MHAAIRKWFIKVPKFCRRRGAEAACDKTSLFRHIEDDVLNCTDIHLWKRWKLNKKLIVHLLSGIHYRSCALARSYIDDARRNTNTDEAVTPSPSEANGATMREKDGRMHLK